MANWEVSLALSGPVTLPRRSLDLNVIKGVRRPYETQVTLTKASKGIEARVIVNDRSQSSANESAVFFVGQMLDVLCLHSDLPLFVSLDGPTFRSNDDHVKRIVSDDEWKEAFESGRTYGQQRPNLSRAISWYRKGRTSEDPIDRLLAIWLSMEVVAHQNSTVTVPRGRSEITARLLECMTTLWGGINSAPQLSITADRLEEMRRQRNDIAHGNINVDIETMQAVTEYLPDLQALAHAFLIGWEALTTNVRRP